jgi:hypothetical protein
VQVFDGAFQVTTTANSRMLTGDPRMPHRDSCIVPRRAPEPKAHRKLAGVRQPPVYNPKTTPAPEGRRRSESQVTPPTNPMK